MVHSGIHTKPSPIPDDNNHYWLTIYDSKYPANRGKNHLRKEEEEK